MFALLTTLLVIGGAATLLVNGGLAFDGKNQSFEDRVNAMTSTDVVSNLLTSSDPSRFEWTVSEDAELSFPAGTLTGPEGAQILASRIGDGHIAHVEVVEVNGNDVQLKWMLGGPVNPGVLVFESVPEGAAIAGVAEVTIEYGEVLSLSLVTTS